MITVGVRDLKNQISQYLQYVKDGQKVIVTEHNRIIAEISQPQETENVSSIREKLALLNKEGKIILAKRQKSCVELQAVNENVEWKSAYNETRAERR